MNERPPWFDRPESVRLLLRGLSICCALLVLADFVIHRHTAHPFEDWYGFYAIYGFVACVLLVVLAKYLRKLVMRDEDYYQR